MDLMFAIVPVLVVAGFVVIIVKGIAQWSHNNASPVLTVEAALAGKQQKTHMHTSTNANGVTTTQHDTSYILTFRVESGDLLEFCVRRGEYHALDEGMQGRLTFQGTRFQGFE